MQPDRQQWQLYIDKKYASVYQNMFQLVDDVCKDDNMEQLAKEVCTRERNFFMGFPP